MAPREVLGNRSNQLPIPNFNLKTKPSSRPSVKKIEQIKIKKQCQKVLDDGYASNDSWENHEAVDRSNDSEDDLNASIFSDNGYPDNEEFGISLKQDGRPENHGSESEEDAESDEEDEDERASRVAKRLNISKNLVAPMSSNSVQKCVIIRCTENKFCPKYTLYLQDGEDRIELVAMKKMTSTNYHIYDMSRGAPIQKKLSKKSGNYLGKLKGVSGKNPEYSLYTNSNAKEQMAAFKFTKVGLTKQIKVGQLPRRLHVLIPPVSEEGVHQTYKTAADSDMLERFKNKVTGKMQIFVTKEPTFERGQYRLNFKGRVTTPSVKNFQIVHTVDGETQSKTSDVIVQFGRVAENSFHLDFKKPFNAFQAFAMALAQFDL